MAKKPQPKSKAKPTIKTLQAPPLETDGKFRQLAGLRLGYGGKAMAANSRAIDPEVDPFTQLGMYTGIGPRPLLYPPLGESSPRELVEIASESNILEECFAAYEENIEGFGYRLVPIPTTDELEADPVLQAAVDDEAKRLKTFFEYCWAEGSFIELRKRIRRDMETVGLGAMEVLRARAGDVTSPIVGFSHVPGHSVRMSPPDPDPVEMTEMRRVDTDFVAAPVYRRFRYYCQVRRAARVLQPVWFKEFGDPRGLNWVTGELDKGTDAAGLPVPSVLGTRLAATELIVSPVKYYPLSPYSIPRWLGNLPAVLGSRAAEEINLWYFDNKMIPPMMLLVSGGALTKGTIRRLEEQMEYQAKGRENFHRVLVVEARQQEAGPQATRPPRLEIKPLTEGQIQDAMFMGYDENTRLKVRAAFRLPPLLTGETSDYNRATSETARQVSEEQVFRPERVRFDATWNRRIMPGIGAKYHVFVSNGPNVTLNEDLIAALPAAEAVGAMTPNLALRILGDILETELPKIDEPWGDVPFTLTLAGFGAAGTMVEEPVADDGTGPATIDSLRDSLAAIGGPATVQSLKDSLDQLSNGHATIDSLKDQLATVNGGGPTTIAKLRQSLDQLQQGHASVDSLRAELDALAGSKGTDQPSDGRSHPEKLRVPNLVKAHQQRLHRLLSRHTEHLKGKQVPRELLNVVLSELKPLIEQELARRRVRGVATVQPQPVVTGGDDDE